jgi:antibiotic biosynthesis monooxygenase (ABM) superfamily enzyme
MGTDEASGATEVIIREIKAGREKDYDEWNRRFLELKKRAPGYLSTTIIAPGGRNSSIRYIITRFKDKDSLESWQKLENREKMFEEVNSYSTPHYRSATGLETWFTLPKLEAVKPPPRWKMVLVTFLAAFIISWVASFFLNPIIGSWPLLASNLVITAILVLGLTYFAMPLLTKLLRRWLYPPD